MKPFLSYFGLQEAAASTGIWFGVYTVGKWLSVAIHTLDLHVSRWCLCVFLEFCPP